VKYHIGHYSAIAGVDILQKKTKNALTGKNSAPAKFPKLSNISRIK